MDLIQKWNAILNKRQDVLNLNDTLVNKGITLEEINTIEQLSGEKLPDSFKTFYTYSNGQPDKSPLLFFNEKFMASDDIINTLEFAKKLQKPEIRTIVNPEKSDYYLKKIIEFYVINALVKNQESQSSWYKMVFSCGVGFCSHPSLYRSKNTEPREKEFINIGDYSPLISIINEFHQLEYECYNWDKLNFTIFSDGRFEVNRTDNDYDEMSFTSLPANAIKKKYFNHKWIPIFSDSGGNFIGIDLDPDVNGKKGQIIIFGRDEEDMCVISNDLESFFAFILDEFNYNNGESLVKYHLHDSIREIIRNKQ